MSSRPNPFDEMERLFDRMSRQFDDATRRWGEEDWGMFGGGDLAVDLVDQDDAFVVTVDVPGFDRNELDLRVSDQTLWIEGEHREETDEGEEESYIRQERRHERMRRSIRLPAPVKPKAVKAKLRNGILTVTIPKAEPASESQTVEIEAE